MVNKDVYADDIVLVSHSTTSMQMMLNICSLAVAVELNFILVSQLLSGLAHSTDMRAHLIGLTSLMLIRSSTSVLC